MFRVSFKFDLGAFGTSTDTLHQDCNIDFPTFKTAKNLKVALSSVLGGPALLLVGTWDGTTFLQKDHQRSADTNDNNARINSDMTWDYTSQQVRITVRNVSSNADTFYATICSDEERW